MDRKLNESHSRFERCRVQKNLFRLPELESQLADNRTEQLRLPQLSRFLRYYEIKQRKPWFNERCPKLLDERKRVKVQWLQDRSENNGDIRTMLRYAASGNFMKTNLWKVNLVGV
jgi:hypothetical protein